MLPCMRVEKSPGFVYHSYKSEGRAQSVETFKNLKPWLKDVSSFSPGSCTMPTIFRGPNKSGMPSPSLTRLTGATMHGQGILHNPHR